MAGNWIAGAVGANPGGLHRTTHTPAGEKIPASKMAAAKAGRYGKLGKEQANLARTLSKFGTGTGMPKQKTLSQIMAGDPEDSDLKGMSVRRAMAEERREKS